MAWAEQNARQAILHDFTDQRNWQCLADIKLINMDGEGLNAVLEDVFVILGRDPDLVDQLKDIDFLMVGVELLVAAFTRDPLDPDMWWQVISNADNGEQDLVEQRIVEFAQRCRTLDFSDQRANIIYGRRLERLRENGHIELFIELSRHLLAHRPNNHELWMELGRLHERRGEIDEAWSCYDHVQAINPHQTPRDKFLLRLKGAMDGEDKQPWSGPDITMRSTFLQQMESLSQRISKTTDEADVGHNIAVLDEPDITDKEHPDLNKIKLLLDSGNASEAFFLARRLVASGERWAEEWLEKSQQSF
jgi:tetratricopeptide (TPR) repeat protein